MPLHLGLPHSSMLHCLLPCILPRTQPKSPEQLGTARIVRQSSCATQQQPPRDRGAGLGCSSGGSGFCLPLSCLVTSSGSHPSSGWPQDPEPLVPCALHKATGSACSQPHPRGPKAWNPGRFTGFVFRVEPALALFRSP